MDYAWLKQHNVTSFVHHFLSANALISACRACLSKAMSEYMPHKPVLKFKTVKAC